MSVGAARGGGNGSAEGRGTRVGVDMVRAAPKMHMCYICGKEYGSMR
jgi:hypothetical protein